MKYQTTIALLTGIVALFLSVPIHAQGTVKNPANPKLRDSTIMTMSIDSVEAFGNLKFKPFKTKVHASYYADRFNGRRTASGKKFSNSKYTAAHRKLPFGTKLRITNETNGKCVVVEVTDRGPFTKGREIDLSKKAFMDIAHNKNSGAMTVTIEVIDK